MHISYRKINTRNNTKNMLSLVLPLLACFLMVIVYVLYMIKPIPEGYTTRYVILYKTAVHFSDTIPFALLAIFAFVQKTEKHQKNRSLPLYALAIKYVIDNIAYLLFVTRRVKNLTFLMLAEENIYSMLIIELLLVLVGYIFSRKTFIVADMLFLLIFSIFSFDVLMAEPTPLRIIWCIANFIWYLSFIPLAETMTIGNTFCTPYLKLVNFFRCRKGLDIIEPEETISGEALIFKEDPLSDHPQNGDDTF